MPRTGKKASQKREPLTKDRIVLKALELVEREGLHGFSFRKLADDLRCEAMSIYYYFPSKAHLFDAMVAHCLAQIDWLPDDTPWRVALRHAFSSFRAVAHKHPAFNQFLVVYRMNSPEGLRLVEQLLGILRRAGFPPEQAARYFRLVGYYFMGATLDETSGYAKGPSAAETLTDAVLTREFPAVAAAGPYFKPENFDATFFTGLDLLLDGIEKAHPEIPKRKG